jgi:hypothetical protein
LVLEACKALLIELVIEVTAISMSLLVRIVNFRERSRGVIHKFIELIPVSVGRGSESRESIVMDYIETDREVVRGECIKDFNIIGEVNIFKKS